jgi:hypothetical protein
MARINETRARWYVARGLATPDERQRSITLTFSPAGLGNASEPWLVQPKENACVGCGVSQAEAAIFNRQIGAGMRPAGSADATAEYALEVVAEYAPGGGAESAVPEGEAAGRAAAGLIRWSVLPHSMRRLLPAEHKAHDSHDIVLLCGGCHRLVEAPYARWRRQLFAAHGIPLDTARCVEDRQAAQVSQGGGY